MKTISLDKAASYRAEWERMATLYEDEAKRRWHAAETDADKYHATHVEKAKDAEKDAKHFRDLIAQLDAEVAAHEKEGRLI